jgi:hypothetical protein
LCIVVVELRKSEATTSVLGDPIPENFPLVVSRHVVMHYALLNVIFGLVVEEENVVDVWKSHRTSANAEVKAFDNVPPEKSVVTIVVINVPEEDQLDGWRSTVGAKNSSSLVEFDFEDVTDAGCPEPVLFADKFGNEL